ncbi:MAG: helix-turn-helix transcriptional regulator [Chitinophagaceae bacterium]|nr:helix-turn-helix transcriptional regulator [Chitinophagaceae bacterium]MCW5925731.1 helix-turn-helix transcriptional regulator [Chitinophagaceae bacterium]
MNKSLQDLNLSLLNTARVDLDDQWNYDNVISPFTRLYLVEDGGGKVYHHQRQFHLQKGFLYLIPAFSYSRYTCDSSMRQCYVHFLEDVGNGLSVYSMQEFAYERPASALDYQLFERLLEINPHRAIEKSDPKTYDNRAFTQKLLELNDNIAPRVLVETQGILKILLSGFIQEESTPSRIKPVNSKRIDDVLYYISEHLAGNLTVQQLAAWCHLNPDYFSRIFREQVMMRPLDYIQNKRIERAQLLLTTTNHSLQEIANLVGLPNISYFNRIFTRISAQTPSAYRKAYWNI